MHSTDPLPSPPFQYQWGAHSSWRPRTNIKGYHTRYHLLTSEQDSAANNKSTSVGSSPSSPARHPDTFTTYQSKDEQMETIIITDILLEETWLFSNTAGPIPSQTSTALPLPYLSVDNAVSSLTAAVLTVSPASFGGWGSCLVELPTVLLVLVKHYRANMEQFK